MIEPDFKEAMDQYWDEASAQATGERNPYNAVERLEGKFRVLGSDAQQQFDEVLISWLAEDDANRRLAAQILLADHGVSRSAVALRSLSDRLALSEDAGAPFERRRVMALAERFEAEAPENKQREAGRGRTHELEKALRDLAAGAISRADLRDVLSASEVVVPGATADQERDLQLPVVRLANGQPAVPLFSSVERMREAGGPAEAALLAFDVLAAAWPEQHDAVLDPGHPWALLVPGEALREPAEVEIQAGEQALWRLPDDRDLPASFLDEVAEALASHPEVRSGWTVIAKFPDRADTREHLFIGVEFDGVDFPPDLTDRLQPIIGPHTRDRPIDLVRVAPESDGLMSQVMRQGKPFYERPRGTL